MRISSCISTPQVAQRKCTHARNAKLTRAHMALQALDNDETTGKTNVQMWDAAQRVWAAICCHTLHEGKYQLNRTVTVPMKLAVKINRRTCVQVAVCMCVWT